MGLSVVTYALCKKYADSKLAQANGQKESKVVQELPTSNIDKNAIYYVIKKKPTGEVSHADMMMYVDNNWEKIGSTEMKDSEVESISETTITSLFED